MIVKKFQITQLVAFILFCLSFVFSPMYAQAYQNEKTDRNEEVRLVVEKSVQDLLAKYHKELPLFETNPDGFLKEMDLVLSEIVDFRLIAARVMGKYGRKASKAQKKRFVEVFKKSLYSTYTKTLVESGVTKINVTKARLNSRSDKKATVDLNVISDNGTVFPIIYSMHKAKDDKWLLENVIVFGVNVGLAFRDRFELQYRKHKGDISSVIEGWEVNLKIDKKSDEDV